MSAKKKTAEQVSQQLTKFANSLTDQAGDHPALISLIGQINRKAEAIVRPSKPVQLSYQDGMILIEKQPYLHRSAFGAWCFKLSEAKGVETGTRVNDAGETVPVYESTYDKELGKNVIPESRKEQLLKVIASFFPDSPIQEG